VGYAPITLDVYATKELANKKAKELAKKEGYKFADGGKMAKDSYKNVDFSNGNYIVKAWQTKDDYNSGNAEEVGKFKNIHDAHLLVDDYLSPNKFEWYAAEIYDGNDGETLYNSEEDGYQEMAKGGTLKTKAKYIPKYQIEEVEVDINGKEKEIDGADLLDGLYVKKASYEKKAPVKKAKGGEVKPKSKKTGNKSVGEIAALAKSIRKEGEKWTDAIKRAAAQMKSKK